MDSSQCGFQRLPAELRQQIYKECFNSEPQPGLLCTNKLIHSEATYFIQRWQQTFSFHISGEGLGFDEFSQWCFKVKGHIPRLNEMQHIILNIHPPDPDKPIEMWHIWNRVLGFCKDLASCRRIPQLSVDFVESDAVKWATNGAAHSTMQLGYASSSFCYSDVGQILALFCCFVNNVAEPKIYLPQSYVSASPSILMTQHRPEVIERQMTGKLTDEQWNQNNDCFWDLETTLWSAQWDLMCAVRS